MSSYESRLARFSGTTKEGFVSEDPKTRNNFNGISYLKSDAPVFKPKLDTQMWVRVLPQADSAYFAYPIRVHFSVGQDKSSMCCPKMLKDENCPLCRYSRQMYAEGNKEIGGMFRARDYNLIMILDRNAMDKGPQLWPIANTPVTEIRAMLENPKTHAILSLDHPEKGVDLFFKKGTAPGKTMNEIHELKLDPDGASTIGTKAEIEKILDYLDAHPMKDWLVFQSAAKMEALAFPGNEDEEGKDEAATEEDSETETASSDSEEQAVTPAKETAAPSDTKSKLDLLREQMKNKNRS